LITVRLATPGEYERVGALTVAVYRGLPVDHLWGGYDEEAYDVATRAKHGDIYVAVDDGGIVGSVMYVADASSEWSEFSEPGEAQFRLLVVDPDARGKGAGAALVQACLERATADGQTILITTTEWLLDAQRIYARFGFVPRPDRDAPYEVWSAGREVSWSDDWIGKPFLAYSWTPPG
jgi:GNAT superfamily N-acetyltransferase